MKWPSVRFTARRLMVAVAILGVFLAGGMALEKRRARFRTVRDYHFSRSMYTMPQTDRNLVYNNPIGLTIFETALPDFTPEEVRQRKAEHDWHKMLVEKYARAARYPWLPLEPDPPEPK